MQKGVTQQKVVMCPWQGIDRASGHPRAQQPLLGSGHTPPVRDDYLDVRGQQRGHLPTSVWTGHKAVKQEKPAVGTTDQGKERGSREERIGQGGGERTKDDEPPMGTAAFGEKGSKGRPTNDGQLIGTASCWRGVHNALAKRKAGCKNGQAEGGYVPPSEKKPR